MPYSGHSGQATTLLTLKKAPRARPPSPSQRAAIRQALATAKPKARASRRKPKAKAPVTIAQTLSYPRKATKPAIPKLATEEKYLLAAAGLTGRRAIKRRVAQAATKLAELKGKRVTTALRYATGRAYPTKALVQTLGKAGARAALRAGAIGARASLGAIGLAALASYYITRAILKRRARTREERAQNAFEAAKAYRLMRVAAEEKQGYPLNPTQLKMAAEAFKQELAKLGLETTDLGKL